MKIVIEIPEEVYDEIMIHNRELRESGKSAYYLEGLIQNGTPLPKGHGRLIDADEISYNHAIARNIEDGHNWNELVATKDEITDLPTIIEADKEVAEE